MTPEPKKSTEEISHEIVFVKCNSFLSRYEVKKGYRFFSKKKDSKNLIPTDSFKMKDFIKQALDQERGEVERLSKENKKLKSGLELFGELSAGPDYKADTRGAQQRRIELQQHEISSLKAENERLLKILGHHALTPTGLNELEILQAQNSRLVEALKQIKDLGWEMGLVNCQEIAEKALSTTSKPEGGEAQPEPCTHERLGSQEYEIEGKKMRVCFDCKIMVDSLEL